MAHISLEEIEKSFGSVKVLSSCSLAVNKGEIVTLLGPSGCGKTTLLRTIAGFAIPDRGRVLIADADVTHWQPSRREVGFVFQNYALFPHLTVEGNIAYGMRVRRRPSHEVKRRVDEALALVSLEPLADRYPIQLSGGQQQRVAIARALVLEPQVLLLDEPFNALDAKLRHVMQVELRKLIKRLGITSIFVTHDQTEALTVSDRVAVMRKGMIEQIAPPLTIYDRPVSSYVANFIGRANLIVETARDGRIARQAALVSPVDDGEVTLVIRPENLVVERAESAEGPGWSGVISFASLQGAMIEYEVEIDQDRVLRAMVGRRAGGDPLPVGTRIALSLNDPASCVVLAGVHRNDE
jgi:ABC-type Fe3+/spermidine/putrescine transport system ATPase subunit